MTQIIATTKNFMMKESCFRCHLKTVDKLLADYVDDVDNGSEFREECCALLENFRDRGNPYIAAHLHRKARSYFGKADLYAREKFRANNLLLKEYDFWKEMVQNSPDPFKMAVKLATVGNVIDYGAHAVAEDIHAQLLSLAKQPVAEDQTDLLRHEVKNAECILFLGDNCGEIVLDRLLIETMNHPDVIYVVRGQAVLNDATLQDAKDVGIDKVATLISNGFDAPSTLIDYSSNELVELFEHADLLISKGQGNFEGLLEEQHPNLFLLLMAKCDPIAEMLGVKKGDLVVKKKERSRIYAL